MSPFHLRPTLLSVRCSLLSVGSTIRDRLRLGAASPHSGQELALEALEEERERLSSALQYIANKAQAASPAKALPPARVRPRAHLYLSCHPRGFLSLSLAAAAAPAEEDTRAVARSRSQQRPTRIQGGRRSFGSRRTVPRQLASSDAVLWI